MICKQCGTDNPKGKNVCLKCGAFLYDSTPRNRVALSRKEKADQRKSYIKGTVRGCFWVFLVMIGLFVVVVFFSILLSKLITPAPDESMPPTQEAATRAMDQPVWSDWPPLESRRT